MPNSYDNYHRFYLRLLTFHSVNLKSNKYDSASNWAPSPMHKNKRIKVFFFRFMNMNQEPIPEFYRKFSNYEGENG